jgi:putative flavoprotein involved in K+ transport
VHRIRTQLPLDRSLAANAQGLPIHDRGIVESCPGLYFIGLLFLYSLSSALVGGVGRDAEHIVDRIVSARKIREAALVRARTARRQHA